VRPAERKQGLDDGFLGVSCGEAMVWSGWCVHTQQQRMCVGKKGVCCGVGCVVTAQGLVGSD